MFYLAGPGVKIHNASQASKKNVHGKFRILSLESKYWRLETNLKNDNITEPKQ